MRYKTEDEVRQDAKDILGFYDEEEVKSGVGQLTTFNQLGFRGINEKPDGWYLPRNRELPAILLEVKAESKELREKEIQEIHRYGEIALTQYKRAIGILYNGKNVRVFIYTGEGIEEVETSPKLESKQYYLSLFTKNKIDKGRIYSLTRQINDCLHFKFGIKNLYHRMVFTACALVATRFGVILQKGMNYSTFHTSIHSTLKESLEENKKKNQKIEVLLEVHNEIRPNITDNQEAIDDFIEYISEISESINSDYWDGEDVMGIFFNEFNRYKAKSEHGQVFTPDHIVSFMYRLIGVGQGDYVLDAACGSGAFLVKSMANMIKESGGVNTEKAKIIKENQLFGIEIDREIFALACANMLIHKDGTTNLEQMDTRSESACNWINSKSISKVLMNPPFERKYGCMQIVKNVLDNVPSGVDCAFILPDKRLEKDKKSLIKEILDKHSLLKIIKLPDATFNEGVSTSIFIFKTGVPQLNKEIFTCHIKEDGLETVKNQGRQDIRDKWKGIEDHWIDIIHKQTGDDTIEWIKPSEHLSYQVPNKEFEIYEEDFLKVLIDYELFKEEIDVRDYSKNLLDKILYTSTISREEGSITFILDRGEGNE